ncbi:polymorphic toxin-type HINT domain-containing protein [Pedobacter cryoconitis]|uniref:Intein n=1 Tax=Pedobacter cryoconitis TaxID=188932 RepID=A0A327T7Q7_9SPHI|nr:polymorphic toxin-type HINT domain-containing protein [Pedobacter cryoconitis]RAJ37359.1 intein [Pedobacter cryoconitis]
MADEELQWLTEKHYLVCPKGAMFKQMKVTSQKQVTFSGNLAATTQDKMLGNVFICLGSMAFMAGAIAGLLVAALALLAVPVAGWALALIIGGALLLAIGAGYMKCKTNAAARIWVNSSPNLVIHHHEGLVVGQSQLSCPPEGAMIDIKATFWEAMMSTTMNNVGHIANFAFGFLAGRGLGSMAGTLGTQGIRAAGAEFLTIARTEMGSMFNPASLFGKMSWFCRGMRGFGMFGAYKGQADIWTNDEMSVTDKLLASGQELVLAIFAAKGASLVCFPAGTPVHTGNGVMAIEDIAIGTLVWTLNEENGQRELKPITATHRRTTLSMMVVELGNGTIFEVTREHRFLVENEWREIQSITALDELEGIDGGKVRIKNIGLISKSAVVYNFDVLDNENYFVTEDGVLVHNGYQKGRLPQTKGRWVEGKPGDGLWKSSRPKVNAITGNKPIPFKNGRPDFSEWKVDEFKVKNMTGAESDFGKIYNQMKKDYGFKTQKEVTDWLSKEKLTPHHLDNETIQLIPKDLHGNIPHKGSASDMRELFGL